MGKQMLKRILKAVVYLVIIVSVLFLLMRLVPDDVYFEKPVLYLYPSDTINVTVKLELLGKLTCTYPTYDNGWTVTAAPDGTLTDEKRQTYNYLYWEGEGTE